MQFTEQKIASEKNLSYLIAEQLGKKILLVIILLKVFFLGS